MNALIYDPQAGHERVINCEEAKDAALLIVLNRIADALEAANNLAASHPSRI